MRKNIFRSVLALSLCCLGFLASAEPWLSSRYAQNCSTCHSPGRVNVAAKERRCTLSCQGCHTNPNGGGLRNTYGKWMQERWLNSFYFKSYKLNQPRPAPSKEQLYSDEQIPKLAANVELKRKVATSGFRLKETTERLPESEYNRHTMREKFVEPDSELALARIPDGDPWRMRRQSFFNAGVDARIFYLDQTRTQGTTDTKVQNSFPMAADVGVSVEPVHGLTAVVESRFLNPPQNPAWDSQFESESRVRSAYLLMDDLPYNSFVQYGLYRPMFGHYDPDHTSLFADLTALDQRAVYKTLTIGTAPNVPFLNVHLIEPMNNISYNQDKGYVVNLGGRFVKYGIYGMLSYWSTKYEKPSKSYRKEMVSWTGGATFGRDTIVLDLTRAQLTQVDVRKDAGSTITVENRFRLWRENYFKLMFENLNTSRDITKSGSSSAFSAGFNSFLFSSTEFQVMYRDLKEDREELTGMVSIREKALWTQLHLFF